MTAVLPKGVTAPNMDALIAATARHHRLVVITRNRSDVRHFAGLEVETPWS